LGRFWPWRSSGVDLSALPRAITPRGDLAEEEKTTIALFRQASPSVVHITTLAVRQDAFSLDVFQIPQGTGSGFVWDNQGRIVTNFHVIRDADAAQVTLADHSSWKARLVGAYPDKDLAVLMVDAPKDRLHPIAIGTSHDLQVGQRLFAIGNPFGLDQSLTTGIISALGREIESVNRRAIKDMIQTDAAINPGNSGGPLLDSSGRLIGVNTAIYSPSGASAGIGFAIPVDEVMDPASLHTALVGVRTAYYLVHSLGTKQDFEREDRQAAANFAEAARQAGVQRIIYLGGLGNAEQGLSPHLRSRQETGEVLRSSGVPVIELRASIIIGSGSLSFELIRALGAATKALKPAGELA